jgi:hypothetical protein
MKTLLFTLIIILNSSLHAQKKHIVLIAGTHHYTPQESLTDFAKKLDLQGFKTTLIKTNWDPEKDSRGLPGMETLKEADLAVLFLRFLKINDTQLKPLMNYVEAGKPIVAMRTTSHAFHYPEGHKHHKLNNDFGLKVMGTQFFLHMKGTADNSVVAKEHPILAGSLQKFKSYGTLYRVEIPKEAQIMTMGYTKTTPKVHKNMFGEHHIKNEEFAPTLWTWTNKFGGKTVGTTFGHKKDFEDENISTIFMNSVKWALQK